MLNTLQIGLGWFPEQAGGLNRFYYDCVRYLPSVGITMQGLVAGSEQVEQESQGQIRAFAPHKTSLLKRWQGVHRMFRQSLQSQNFSLVVSHFALYTFPVLNQIGDRPLVMHFQGPWALESKVEGASRLSVLLKESLERIHHRRVERFIVLSTAFRELLHQTYQIPLEKIHIVPPGVDLNQFMIPESRLEARLKFGWDLNRPILFAARRLIKRTGVENLIAAMDRVRKHHPEALLLIAGKGELAQSLQQQIDTLNLANHVRLLGFVPDDHLALAYRAADFSIVPTMSLEGFGLIMIESLAAGTPVVGTPVAAIPEVLRPLSEDLVLEGHRADQIAQGILEILSGQRRLPSAEDCIAYVKEHYAWSVVAQQIKAVYEAAL